MNADATFVFPDLETAFAALPAGADFWEAAERLGVYDHLLRVWRLLRYIHAMQTSAVSGNVYAAAGDAGCVRGHYEAALQESSPEKVDASAAWLIRHDPLFPASLTLPSQAIALTGAILRERDARLAAKQAQG